MRATRWITGLALLALVGATPVAEAQFNNRFVGFPPFGFFGAQPFGFRSVGFNPLQAPAAITNPFVSPFGQVPQSPFAGSPLLAGPLGSQIAAGGALRIADSLRVQPGFTALPAGFALNVDPRALAQLARTDPRFANPALIAQLAQSDPRFGNPALLNQLLAQQQAAGQAAGFIAPNNPAAFNPNLTPGAGFGARAALGNTQVGGVTVGVPGATVVTNPGGALFPPAPVAPGSVLVNGPVGAAAVPPAAAGPSIQAAVDVRFAGNGQLQLTWTGDWSITRSVTYQLLDSNRRVLTTRKVTNPTSVTLRVSSRARFYRVTVEYTDGTTSSVTARI